MQATLNHTEGIARNSDRTEDSRFPPLNPGDQLIAEYERTCEKCGELYYQREAILQSGFCDTVRTRCSCCFKEDLKQQESERRNSINSDINRLFKSWNLLQDHACKHMYLEKFRPEDKSHQKALTVLKSFAPGRRGICLCGLPGRGKTHLAVGIARKCQAQGYTVLAIKSIDLLNRLRRCYASKDVDAEAAIMRVLRDVDLLIFDDIGTEKPTGWVLEKLYEIIDYRHNRKSTVFTTNLDGGKMSDKLSAALTSRIYADQLQIEGRDWRVKDDLWADIGTEIRGDKMPG